MLQKACVLINAHFTVTVRASASCLCKPCRPGKDHSILMVFCLLCHLVVMRFKLRARARAKAVEAPRWSNDQRGPSSLRSLLCWTACATVQTLRSGREAPTTCQMALSVEDRGLQQFQAREPLQLNLNSVNLLVDGQKHTCTRFCQFRHLFGNVFQCSSSGSTHVCDTNCNQQIFHDSQTKICRLSRRLFACDATR